MCEGHREKHEYFSGLMIIFSGAYAQKLLLKISQNRKLDSAFNHNSTGLQTSCMLFVVTAK